MCSLWFENCLDARDRNWEDFLFCQVNFHMGFHTSIFLFQLKFVAVFLTVIEKCFTMIRKFVEKNAHCWLNEVKHEINSAIPSKPWKIILRNGVLKRKSDEKVILIFRNFCLSVRICCYFEHVVVVCQHAELSVKRRHRRISASIFFVKNMKEEGATIVLLVSRRQ
jgi:hypothetical protein